MRAKLETMTGTGSAMTSTPLSEQTPPTNLPAIVDSTMSPYLHQPTHSAGSVWAGAGTVPWCRMHFTFRHGVIFWHGYIYSLLATHCMSESSCIIGFVVCLCTRHLESRGAFSDDIYEAAI